MPLLIEKPLATDLAESAARAQGDQGRQASTRWSATPSASAANGSRGKEKVRTGALGDVTLVTSRAFMNRLVAIDNYKRTDDPKTISPMVISGTHALDIVMWYMEAKTPVECLRPLDRQGARARSTRASTPPPA